MRKNTIALAASVALASLGANAANEPPNNLGKQSNQAAPALQVVYPSLSNIVESQVSEIEDFQLTTEQTQRIKDINLKRERERATPYNEQPVPVTRTMAVNLEPGVPPPVLHLSRGQLSSVVFSDVSGQPWYIESISMNRQLFADGKGGAASNKDDAPSNVMTLEPLSPAAYGNVSVQLKGLPTPVIFVLTAGQKVVDMRIDAKISGRNPDGFIVSEIIDQPKIDDALTLFLDNVPPTGAKRLTVSGMEGVLAWYYKDNLYLRAKGEAQYPAFLSAARSTSGMTVYRFAQAHNSVTLLSGGKAVTVFIQ